MKANKGEKWDRRKCPVYYALACVAGVERGRGMGRALLPPPSRVVSRPNSLPQPFRTPATKANCAWDI